MFLQISVVFVIAIFGTTLASTAEFIPKSFYVIHNGVKSPVVLLREKRSLQQTLLPLVRMRRSSGSSGSDTGSGSYSSSSSFAGSGTGTGGGAGGPSDAIYFGDNFQAGFEAVKKLAGFPAGFPNTFPVGIPVGIPHGAPGSSSGAGYSNNNVGGEAGYGGDAGHGLGGGPNLHSRFGGDEGVSYSGQAEGAKGVYSASSSSIDGDGNVKYSVKTGKF